MAARLTPERADTIVETVLAAAERGEPWAVTLAWDRLEGKPVNRNENGEAGTFTGMEDMPTPELLKIVGESA